MKSVLNFTIIILSTLWITACRNDDTNSALSNTLQEGTWRVAEFYHVDHFETGPYKNYVIAFTVLNTVTASGTNFLVGKWDIDKNGDLNLDFGRSFLFEKFNTKWKVVSYDDQQIQLEEFNASVNATDHLILEKI